MKKYILTDPCYLVKNPADWGAYIGLTTPEDASAGDDFLSFLLGTEAHAAWTSAGDWANELHCDRGANRLLRGMFTADAGLVAFLELTEAIEAALPRLAPYSYALLEAEAPVCIFDTSNPRWTVIHIQDADGSAYRSREYKTKIGGRC